MSLKTVTTDSGKTYTYDAQIPSMDDGMAFFQSQLTAYESRWYKTKYGHINFPELVDVNTETPEWADSVAFRMYDAVGSAKMIGANADDLPNVAATAKQFDAKIGYGGNRFEYSLDELRKSSHLGIPLDAELAQTARRTAEEKMQDIVYFGDEERGMTGLFNNPNIPVENSTLDWYDPTTTAMEIIEDINRILNLVFENTKGISTANTLVLSSKRWTLINQKYASDLAPSADNTVMALLKTNNVYTATTGQPLRIFQRFQLNQEQLPNYIPGYTDGDLIMAYEKTPENLEAHMPMPWRPTAPQPRNLKISVPCEFKISGTVVRYPLTAVYSKQVKR